MITREINFILKGDERINVTDALLLENLVHVLEVIRYGKIAAMHIFTYFIKVQAK